MKSILSTLAKYVLIAVVIGLAILNIRGCIRENKLEKELASLRQDSLAIRNKVQTEAKIIARQVDKFGSEHVTIKATENLYPLSAIKSPAVSVPLLDTIAMALKIRTKQLEEALRIQGTMKASNLRANYVIDSLKRRTVVYRDRYVNLSYTPNQADSAAGTFDLAYNADIKVAQYYKRNWFLGAKKSYIDIWSVDPRLTINGVDRYKVEQKAPSFGLRVQAAGNVNPQTGAYGAGLGARIDFNRFSLQYNYLYYPTTGSKRGNLQLNYDIIRF